MRLLKISLASSVAHLVTGTSTSEGERPIAKVIKLLRDMTKQMEAEREDDDAVHKKYQCWCKAEEESKSSIAKKQKATMERTDATAKAAFSESQKKGATRVATFENFTAKQQELEQLRNKCMNEKGDFSKADQELEKSIMACRNAVTVLKKHNFIQGQSKVTKQLRQAIEKTVNNSGAEYIAENHPQLFSAVQGFLDSIKENPSTSFLQVSQSPGFSSYDNQSGQIFGILSQMLEDLERDQSEGAKTEKARIAACQEGDAALTKEVNLLQNTLNALDKRLGELAETQANNKEDFVAAKEAYGNAVEFLGKLKTMCEKNDADYQSRTKSRNVELVAIADTIKILDNDDAFKAFGNALGKSDPSKAVPEESFLQLSKVGKKIQRKNDVINAELRRSAVESLEQFATKSSRTYLVQYLIKSAAVNKDAIKKVQDKIDVLVGELKLKQKEEIDMRRDCIADLNNVKLDMEEKSRDKANSEEESAGLEEELAVLAQEIEDLNTESAKLNDEAAKATEQRKKETAEFQVVVKDHQEVQAILQKAIDRMNMAYSDMKVQYALAQKQVGADFTKIESTDDTPGTGPAAFTNEGKTEQNAGGNKVVALLREIQSDSEKTEADATQSENDAQAAYESFMNETKRSLDKNANAVAQKTERSGRAEEQKVEADEMVRSLGKAIFDLTEEDGSIHKRCDFVLNNFDARQQARSDEMAALQQAKQLLSGMTM